MNLMTFAIVFGIISIVALVTGAIWWTLRKRPAETEEDLSAVEPTEPIAPTYPPRNRKATLLICTAVYVLVLAVGFMMTTGGIKWWALALVAIACHLASSIKVVGVQENGVMVLFGRIIRASEARRHFLSGPHFVPWPMRMAKFTKNEIVVHFGTAVDNETIRKANQSTASQSWFIETEPIRINFGIPETAEDRKRFANDPFAERLTTDPHMYFTWKIHDPATYLETVGRSVQEGIERIIANCTRVMQDMAGKTFVAKAIGEIDFMSTELRKSVENLVGDPNAENPTRDSWGVDIMEVGIKDLGTSHEVNKALRDRASVVTRADGEAIATERTARANRVKVEEAAAAEKVKLTAEGQGRAAAKSADAIANAEFVGKELEARAKVAETAGGQRLVALEAWKEGLKGGRVVLVSSDMSSISSALIAGKEILTGTSDKTPPPPPSGTTT